MLRITSLLRAVRGWRGRLAAGSLVALVSFAAWLRCGPLPPGLLDAASQPSTVIVDRHGEQIYEVRSSGGTRSDTLSADALPKTLLLATLAAEDVRFRSHVGLDPVAMARALLRDVRALRVVEGGSTITQQVAKLLISRQTAGRATRGWTTKAREAVVALRLEHRLTKDEILALYLNLAPYGNQIDGAERAAQAYFGRGAATLTPAECAFLAALPQQPGRFNPWRDIGTARPRQLYVLDVMAARGWLSAADLAVARAERLSLNRAPSTLAAPHFVERVLAAVGASSASSASRPRRIETTLDAPLQRTIQDIIAANRGVLDIHHAANVAVVVLDNRTSEWLAWEGSGNYFDSAHGGAIDGVVAARQPGSALKPFTYAAAFERGVTPDHVLADVESQFPTAEPGILYSPRNYDGQFRGPMLIRAALAGSENVPAVALASEIGVPAVARMLRQAGVTTLDRNAAHYGLGITLGNAEVRLDELVAAYAIFARGGDAVAPALWRTVDGRAAATPPVVRVMSPRTAFWITDILSDNDARAYIFGRGGQLEFPFTVAAKTGTSQSYRDNWAIGYTRDVTVGVWVGNFDRSPLHNSSGVTGAGPIFHDVMMAAVERVHGSLPIDDAPIAAIPADLQRVELCAVSGLAPTDACPSRVTEWLPAGAGLPRCTWHATSGGQTSTVWPEEYRVWAHSARAVAAAPLASLAPMAATTTELSGASGVTLASAQGLVPGARPARDRDLTIVAPLGGAVYLLDPTLRPDYQTLPLRARGGTGGLLRWTVDGEAVGMAVGGDAVRWPLARGAHLITVEDADGRTAATRVVVR